MTRVVHLHVGAPKTGTTYLQDRLSLNAARLADHGVHVPTSSRFVEPALFHFRAALDLLEQDWGGEAGHAEGAWPQLVKKVRRLDGTVIVSHEILAPGTRQQGGQGDERPRGQRGPHRLLRPRPRAPASRRVAGEHQAGPQVVVPAVPQQGRERQAVVLPRAGPAHRAQHLGRPPASRADPRRDRAGEAADRRARRAAVAALLRGVRHRPGLGAAGQRARQPVARDRGDPAGPTAQRPAGPLGAARGELRPADPRHARPARAGQPRVAPGPAAAGAVRLGRGAGQLSIDWLRGSGVHVIGDLDDLRPVRPAEDELWRNPDRVRAKPVLQAALDALEAMTREAARRPDPDRQLGNLVRQGADRLRKK